MKLTQRDVSDIQELLKDSPYSEIVLETADQRLVLRRTESGTWVQEIATLAKPQLLALPGAETAEAAAETTAATSSNMREGLVNVLPPLPGTFYRAPKPGAQPFVEIGESVTEDTVIGIIETMKLMNPVRSGAAGDVVEICAQNGTFVETKDVLMRVRPPKDLSS